MKNLFSTAFLLIVFSTTCFTQSDYSLKLSQVKLVSVLDTVPVGKVWKIESALGGVGLFSTTGTGEYTKQIVVNGNNVVVAGRAQSEISYDGNQSYGEYTRLPIWLPEGSTLAAGTGVFEISILEFNVVPN